LTNDAGITFNHFAGSRPKDRREGIGMKPDRRTFLGCALALPAAAWLENFRAMAATQARQAKITAIKTMGLDNVPDACLIRIETDAGFMGYGEAGLPSAAARARIAMIAPLLIGQDPLAIERHFYVMTSTQDAGFAPSIPTVSGIDIALWDLAGKIMDCPVYRLLGGPIREYVPVYSHGDGGIDWLDKAQCRSWAAKVKAAPEKFTTFKFGYTGETAPSGDQSRLGGFSPTLDNASFNRAAKAYANIREALGDDIDIAMHCLGQYDTRSAIGLCKAIEPTNPTWIEDPLTAQYSEAWLELKRSTRVPLLQGEKVEMVQGFRPYLDNQVLDIIHPDPAYAGGITACLKIADYAALTRTPVGLHSGPCSLIRWFASMHLGATVQNFFKVENALGPFRGNKEGMANGAAPMVRNSQFPVPRGPGLGLDLNQDWLRSHVAKDDRWWG
jgi:L-alanine-DL-glutamate epimerase-like enolase superfamily enzyme